MNFAMTINGRQVPGGTTFEVRNPATDGIVGSAPSGTDADVDAAIAAARAAQPSWAAVGSQQRADLLMSVADVFEANARSVAEIITQEQGKPLGGPGSMFEMEAAVGFTRVPASLDLNVEVVFEDDTRRDEMHYRPLGVVGAIAPWNWPVMIAIWQIMPALRMGNTVVLKPSEYTPLATLEVGRLIDTVLPAGVVNVVSGGASVGARIAASNDIDKIMFTGSVATGRKVAAAAAETLARLTLELGGNDAAIVLPDVDPDAIAEGLFWGSFINMGQTCACVKRLYVHEAVHDGVVEALVRLADAIRMGDGMDESNVLGPIQNRAQFDTVAALVDSARADGATVVRGGCIPEGPGLFYPITIVTDITNGSRLVDEEQFGPVIPIIKYRDVDEAIRLANDSEVGLGASVWSSDTSIAIGVAQRMEAGTVWINQHGTVHPMVPFGGAKSSGFGQEFGIAGLKGVTQPTVISIAK